LPAPLWWCATHYLLPSGLFLGLLPDIGATARTLDLSGTGSQAVEAIIVMG